MPSLTKLFLLPTALAASPLLLAAGQLPNLDAMSLACELSEAGGRTQNSTAANDNALAGYIVQPVSTLQQAIITSEYELLTIDEVAATPVGADTQSDTHDQCKIKEEPNADSVEETTDVPTDELPDLGTDTPAQPNPQSDSPAPTDSPAEATSEGTSEGLEPSEDEDSTTSSPSPEAEQSPSPLIERPTPPPPSDPNRDPSNFTPEDPAPTPFDGIVEPTLESLPDGSYRYLSGNYEYGNYTDEQLIANGGSVFLLTKVGNKVTGNLLPRLDLPGICVTGTVSGDMVSGSAYPHEAIILETDSVETETDSAAVEETVSPEIDASTTETSETPETDNKESAKESIREIGDTFEPYGSGALQIRQSRIVEGQIYYEEAMLDLSNFSRINAGSALAPTDCGTSAAQTDS